MVDLIDRYAGIARPIILQDFAPNCCIAATAITIEVFRRLLGIPAQPLCCRAIIFNRAFVNRSEREGRIPQGPAEVHEWTNDGASWSLGVGFPTTRMNGWPGHLVAIVGETMIDASIEQANRPAKNIILPPVLTAKAPEDFRLGRAKFYLSSTDGLMIYEPLADRSWRNARDWIDRTRHRRAIELLVKALERGT